MLPIMDPCVPPTMQSMLETPKTNKSRRTAFDNEVNELDEKTILAETPPLLSKASLR